jgi:flavin-dependent dehydrogenase
VGVKAENQALIVGGGPAGLATAIALRLAGVEAQVFDRRQPPIDKPCGEGLMPDGVERLLALGVEIDPIDSARFYGIRYRDRDRVAEARFRESYGLGIRRPRLHAAMIRRAEELGVTLNWGVKVLGLTATGIETDRGNIEGQWRIGADGLRSKVRGWAGLESGRRDRSDRPVALGRFGVRGHFAVKPWSDCVEVHWADGCEAYVTPVGAQEVGVAFLWSGERVGFEILLRRFPHLESKLQGARRTSEIMGTGPLEQHPKGVQRGSVALVGDAAGYRDAITGEGLALAFHQAGALAKAIALGDMGIYERSFRRLMRLPFGLISTLLMIEKRPRWRRRLIRTLAEDGELFERLLAIHARQEPLTSLGVGRALKLGWRVIAPN